MKKHFISCLLFCAAIFLAGCKKDQPDMASVNSPCNASQEITASFIIEEISSPYPVEAKYTETDAVFGNRNVRFSANISDAEYTWYIGAEVLHTKEVTRYFDTNLIGKTIPVTLVVRKTPNSICFPGDDGYDSLVKKFTVHNYNDSTLMEGTFRVKSPLLNDSTDIRIDYRIHPIYGDYIALYNYDGLGSNCTNADIVRKYANCNYRQFWMEDNGSITCNRIAGEAYYRLDGIVELNFTTADIFNTNLKNYKYRGRKL